MSELLEAYVDMQAEKRIPDDYSLEVTDETEPYIAIADCSALGKFALEGAGTAPDLPELPQDTQQALAVIRQWYHTTDHPMDMPPRGTYTALTGYMARLKSVDPGLRKKLQDGLGDEEFLTGLRHVFGAIFYDNTRQATTSEIYSKVLSLHYDAVATAFLEDALAIHKLGIDEPATKAAYFAPEHFMQPDVGEATAAPKPALESTAEPEVEEPTYRKRAATPSTSKVTPTAPPSASPLAHYINTGKYTTERLSSEQEDVCGELVAAGRAAQEQLGNNHLTPNQKESLEQQVRLGKIAQRQLVESRLDLVVAIAKNYYHQNADLDDLVQDGNLGLMRAAKDFDPQKGSFSSYARTWIKKYILESIVETYPLVREPVTHVQAKWKIDAFITTFKAAHDRPPTRNEVLEGTSVKPKTYALALASVNRNQNITLDGVVVGSGGSPLVIQETIADTCSLPIEVQVLHTADPLMNIVQHTLETLEPEAGIIVALRFGLDLGPGVLSEEFISKHNIEPGKEYSLEEIAPMLSMSRPTAWRRYDKAMSLFREQIKQSPELEGLFFQK